MVKGWTMNFQESFQFVLTSCMMFYIRHLIVHVTQKVAFIRCMRIWCKPVCYHGVFVFFHLCFCVFCFSCFFSFYAFVCVCVFSFIWFRILHTTGVFFFISSGVRIFQHFVIETRFARFCACLLITSTGCFCVEFAPFQFLYSVLCKQKQQKHKISPEV